MSAEPELDVVVVGGGAVGLALARALTLRGRGVTLLEAEAELGQHTSSRSSEVIHAGLHYPPGSLKARACLAGSRRLYAYAAERGIEHRRIGKLVVATDESELAALDAIAENAALSGVRELERLGAREVSSLEPAVRAAGALFSPSSGIIDSHGLLGALKRDALAGGAQLVTRSPLLSGTATGDGFELHVGGPEPSRIRCRQLVNAAGPWAQDVARALRGVPAASIPGQFFAKGHYFTLRGRSPFSHLVYPVPEPGGLGVHVTLDLSGAARFGPDVCWVDSVDYRFDAGREAGFIAAIRRYFPALEPGALLPGHTGVRAKLTPPGGASADFVLQDVTAHGVPGLVSLYGIESPGLTAALELAELALDRL